MDRLGKDVGALEDRCTVRVYELIGISVVYFGRSVYHAALLQ